jgi:hypothetical protein
VNDQDNDFLRDLLRERVFSLLGNVGPGTPPQTQVAEATVLAKEGRATLAAYRTFLQQQVGPLNAAFKTAGLATLDLDALPPKTKPDPNADEHASRRSESE